MKRHLLFAVAALAVAPAIAKADPDVSEDRFRLISAVNAPANRTWEGGFASQDYKSQAVWCIDEVDGTFVGLEYNVWVTRLSGNDFSKTDRGGAFAGNYRLAAYMASFYGPQFDGTATSVDLSLVGLGSVSAQAMQDAIWRVMGYSTTSGVGTTIYNYFTTTPNVIDPSFDFSTWYVVSSKNPGCQNRPFNTKGCNIQEMLVNDPDRPQEVVPEPATMTLLATGLAGLAGASRRRKKQS